MHSLLFLQTALAPHPGSAVGAEDAKISGAATPFHFQYLKTHKLAITQLLGLRLCPLGGKK